MTSYLLTIEKKDLTISRSMFINRDLAILVGVNSGDAYMIEEIDFIEDEDVYTTEDRGRILLDYTEAGSNPIEFDYTTREEWDEVPVSFNGINDRIEYKTYFYKKVYEITLNGMDINNIGLSNETIREITSTVENYIDEQNEQ